MLVRYHAAQDWLIDVSDYPDGKGCVEIFIHPETIAMAIQEQSQKVVIDLLCGTHVLSANEDQTCWDIRLPTFIWW